MRTYIKEAPLAKLEQIVRDHGYRLTVLQSSDKTTVKLSSTVGGDNNFVGTNKRRPSPRVDYTPAQSYLLALREAVDQMYTFEHRHDANLND